MELNELAGVLKSASGDDRFDFCEVLKKISGDSDCYGFGWCDDCKKFIMDSIARELEKLQGRIMPDGMEWLVEAWPRFEDDTPLCIGEDVNTNRGVCTVKSVRLYDGSFTLYGEDKHGLFEVCHISWQDGERVKRPAKVLDADGVEIRVGDVLYRKSDGHMVKVVEVDEKTFTDADDYVRPGEGYTHRAPVIAADGKPLREGETVYLLHGDWCGVYPCYGYHGGEKIKVVELHTCHSSGGVRCENDTGFACYPQPSQLTHECSDSWERLEEDAGKDCWEYWECKPSLCPSCCPNKIDGKRPFEQFGVHDCYDAAVKDIVRRAYALAGVSE